MVLDVLLPKAVKSFRSRESVVSHSQSTQTNPHILCSDVFDS